jgi:L-ascorbate metabolism protein UlaG (beta-lactamase superfamily)
LNISLIDNVRVAWKFLFSDNHRTPAKPLPVMPTDLSPFNTRGGNQLNATWLGHSSLMINVDGFKILTDPVFEKRISIIGPTRFSGELPVSIEQLPRIDAVIISHDHYDHLNKWSIRHLVAKTGRFIVPLGVGVHLSKWGVPADRIVELGWWEEVRLGDRLVVAATPAQHFSGRGFSDRNKTLWASWVIAGPEHRVFFSGDSGYFTGFKRIGDMYGPFDMTFLECGAYDMMWHNVHMLPEETVQAHLDLGGKVLHTIHWGTFKLALHPWYEPMERISQAAARNNIDLALPKIGDTTRYGHAVTSVKWWQLVMQKQATPIGE